MVRKGLKYGAIAASAVATAAKVAHDVHQTYQQYQGGPTTTRRPGSATIDHITSGIERYNERAGTTRNPRGRATRRSGPREGLGDGRRREMEEEGTLRKGEMPRLLELFSGTGSPLGRCFRRLGWLK